MEVHDVSPISNKMKRSHKPFDHHEDHGCISDTLKLGFDAPGIMHCIHSLVVERYTRFSGKVCGGEFNVTSDDTSSDEWRVDLGK